MCESPKHIIRCKILNESLAADLPENPFASTHSLDANPFDDPPTQHGGGFPNDPHDTRLEQLSQRERDLERREQELNAKAEHIRSHGKNNWPFCEFYKHSSSRLPIQTNSVHSLPPYLSFNIRRNTRSVTAFDHTALSIMACPTWHPHNQHDSLFIHSAGGIERRRQGFRWQHWVSNKKYRWNAR